MKLSRTAIVLGVLVAAHLAFSLFVNPAGYLTYDSGTYHFMVETLAETGSFLVQNGYEEYPSPELRVAQLRIAGDHLASQYPEFLTVLGLPFYLVFGYHGLLILNALCFLGINALIFRLAHLLFDSSAIAYTSMAVYSFATYAWEYSHSSYPHLSSTLFVLAAYTLLTQALVRRPSGLSSFAEARLLLFAGVLAGFAVGLRLDAAFAIPGLFVPLVLGRPLRPLPILTLAAGLVPGLAFLAVTNFVKFGTLNPFSYGRTAPHETVRTATTDVSASIKWYLPILFLAIFVTVSVLVLQRLPARHRGRAAGVLVAILVIVAASFPDFSQRFVTDMVHGTYQIVVDLRIRDLDIVEPALFRTQSGAMIYIGGVKKSLLQSCPYLVLVPLLALGKRRESLKRLAFLAIVPASFIGFYGYLAWHGSVALNMRYLNPILPFTSILAAVAWCRISEHVTPRLAALYSGTVFAALLVFFWFVTFTIRQQELWFLTMPLAIAAALLLLEIVRRLRWTPTLGGPLVCYMMLTAFAYSGAMAFGRDYPASAAVRDDNLQLARGLEPFIEDDSLVFSNVVDVCWGMLGRVEGLRIARPESDQLESFPGLAKYHLDRGRKVYMAYTPNELRLLGEHGYLAGFQARVVNVWATEGLPSLVLFELGLPSES